MRRINPPIQVTVRRNGFKLRTIARLKFEAGPDVAGWVNYRNKVYPVFADPKGNLYLNEDGWASTCRYPLIHERDATRNPPSFPFLRHAPMSNLGPPDRFAAGGHRIF